MLPDVLVILTSIVIGSFLNNMISSFIKNVKIDLARSYCMCGKQVLGFRDLIPLLSYINSKGKCRYCGIKLTSRYFFIELLSAITGLLCYFQYGFTLQFFIYFTLFLTLISIGTIDLFSYRIPNVLVFTLIIIAACKILLLHDSALLLYNLVCSAFISVVFIITNFIMLRLKGKEAIGYGDIKLIAVLTLFFNIPLSLIGIWFSAIIAIPGFYLIKNISDKFRDEIKIPFGFFISIVFIICSLLEDRIINFYYSLLGI